MTSRLPGLWERDGNIRYVMFGTRKLIPTNTKSFLLVPRSLSHLLPGKKKKKTLLFNLAILAFFCDIAKLKV